MDWKANARLNETAVQLTGERHCRSCDSWRKEDGGRWRVGANGTRPGAAGRWRSCPTWRARCGR